MKQFVLFFFIALTSVNASAQKLSEEDVKALVESGSYFFRAEQMQPMGARSRVITELYYTLQVRDKEVSADLPYVGRAYQASPNPTDAGVKFTSKNVQIDKQQTKKGNYEIRFVPKDDPDVRECILTIYKNGKADLLFTFNRRQNISYHGVILPLSELK